MAISVGGASRGTFVEVNVVPLIDILLVLLVIFMIIPHQRTGLQADLPQPARKTTAEAPSEPIVVQVLADGSLRINQQPVAWDDLGRRLEEIYKDRASHVAFLRGDEALDFQVVARVIDIMSAAGITSVALMTPGLDKVAKSN
jgi:biopolymer transport protein TolR